MCGIFGYVGPRNAVPLSLAALTHLEYRGYDSAGLAGVHNGDIYYCKKSGKVHVLEEAIKDKPLVLNLALAHTRWATHGAPTDENAHPHFDEVRSLAIVHNGIIENHEELRAQLLREGHAFYSDTDTEVIAKLIASLYRGNLLHAVQGALPLLKGFWGFAVIHRDHPDLIVASACENPIAIGHSAERCESVVASDANAFEEKDLKVAFLKDREVACIRADRIDVYDQAAAPIELVLERFYKSSMPVSKQGYPHFMLKEIYDQPQGILRAVQGRCVPEFGTATLDHLPFNLTPIKRILILACGTSWHAGLVAAHFLEEKARIPATAEIASEFRYKNPTISEDTLVLAISQSGETLDTIAAVREVKSKGAKVIALCNVPGSALVREADHTLFLHAGPERSVCSTKAYTSQLTVLYLFSLYMARLRHMGKEEGQDFLAQLERLPEQVAEVLQTREAIHTCAKKYAHSEHFFFVGRQYMHAAGLEAALKLKEISYITAEAFPAGEMKHGPIAVLHHQLAVVALCGNARTQDKLLSNLMEIKAREAPLIAFAPPSLTRVTKIADEVVWLPEVQDELAPVLYGVALQLFAYFTALELGTDIDRPRHLAKSVTVE